MRLAQVVDALGNLAPLRLAAEWDNVGLLMQPSTAREIQNIFLTIDLTDAVMDEALAAEADLIVAYHPPLFAPIRRLGPSQSVVQRAVEQRLALYSPHTALDAVRGGINDWLLEAFAPMATTRPLVPAQEGSVSASHKVVVYLPVNAVAAVREAMAEAGAGQIGGYSRCSFSSSGHGTFFAGQGTTPVAGETGQLNTVEEVRLEMVCDETSLLDVGRALVAAHPYEEPAWHSVTLAPRLSADNGQGRSARLQEPMSLEQAIEQIKSHLKLPHLRLATPTQGPVPTISTVAVCPGAGGSLFANAPRHDLFLTGEMRHHDVLTKINQGAVVVLTEHTNCERGYLPRFADALHSLCRTSGGQPVQIRLSQRDSEPLRVV